MPDSRTERIAFAVGLGAIVALAIALIPAYRHYNNSTSAPHVGARAANAEQAAYRSETPAARMTPASPKAPAAATRTQKTKASTAAKAKAKPAAKPVVKQLKVTLAATQGDCWLAVRTGSKDGKLVYTGTLVKGKSLDVSAKSLWIRFGAPQNVQLTVNGDGASIPTSSQDVVITRNGIQAAPA